MWIVEALTNPIYADASGDVINCEITFDNIGNPLPFTANANDVEEHGRAVYAALVAGEYGPIAPYVPPPAQVPPNVA